MRALGRLKSLYKMMLTCFFPVLGLRGITSHRSCLSRSQSPQDSCRSEFHSGDAGSRDAEVQRRLEDESVTGQVSANILLKFHCMLGADAPGLLIINVSGIARDQVFYTY